MTPADFLLRQEQQRFESQIASWARQVLAQRSLMDAVRLAAHPPHPGPLLRGVRVLSNGPQHRARSQVEDHLLALVDAADRPLLAQAVRGLSGHWPRAAHRAQERLRTTP